MGATGAVALAVGLTAVAAWSQHQGVFRAGVDVVYVAVTVENPDGGMVTDLALDNFELTEDGVPQTVQYLAAGDRLGTDPALPLHVGILLDVSESMTHGLEMTRTAAIRLISRLPGIEDVTLVDFDEQVRAARFEPRDFPRLVERIRGRKVSGWTALYDAVGLYLSGASEQNGRKIMLLYTDGEDTRSSLRYPELLDLLRASDVTVYAVGAVETSPGGPQLQLQRRALLEQVAETTGGLAFFPGSLDELDAVYDRILETIRAEYILGYQSANVQRDGSWRSIEVRVKRPDGKRLRLRAREGYFAPHDAVSR
jgi:VWFA-related protein